MTPGTAPKPANSSAPIKPTFLAFHGSGSNGTVHTVQLARLMRAIKPYFNVESLEAPFPSPAGPGVLPFFDGCGPFKRWLPPTEKVTIEAMKRGESSSAMAAEVETIVRDAVYRVRAAGSHVVGLIGFSQGTKVVAGLLRGSEIRRALVARGETVGDDTDWCDFDIALSVCASYPPPLIPPSVSAQLKASSLSEEQQTALVSAKITTPVFHVQGLQDEWKWAGENLIKAHYETGSGEAELVEWEMGHHYPVPAEDSERIRDWILRVLGKAEGESGRVGL
ncbi:hypothetical protein IQ07DRAFT_584918 [Pyrenochaeta sp. DS3sAY3a]|nr:hypothetical protein IQ07DRAFT_584918 [Pyrenochaeta sp. DS3sAY3a]